MKITYDARRGAFEFQTELGGKLLVTEKVLQYIKEGRGTGIKISDVVDEMSDEECRRTLKFMMAK